MNSFANSIYRILKFLPSKIFPFFSNYFLIILISGSLTLAEYGEYFYLITIFTAIYTIAMSVMPQLVMRYCLHVNILKSKYFKNYFLLAYVISILITLVLIFFSIIKMNMLLYAIFYILSYSVLEILLALCRSRESEFKYNIVNIIRSFSPIFILLIFKEFKLISISEIFLSYIFTYLILAIIFIKSSSLFKGSIELDLNNKSFYKYYLHFSIITGSLFLNSKLNFLVSKHFFSKEIIGIYSFNLDFFEKFIQNITSILNIAFTVTAYKLFDSDRLNELKIFLRNNLLIYILITIPVIFLFIIFYNPIFNYLNRENFEINIIYLAILLFSFFLIGLGHRFSIVFLVTKTTDILAILTFTSLLFSLVCNYFFLKYFNIIGIYLTQFISSFFWLMLLFIFSRKKIKFI